MASERPAVHCEVIQALQNVGTVNVFVICLDKVNSAHNVIDRPFGLGLARAVYLAREKASKGDVDMVVVCSAKERSFLAGADITHELKYVGVDGSRRAFTDLRQFQDVLCVLEALPVPTVAVLNGATLGGGLELALACDYRIADAEHCTQIGLPEVKLGYLPGAGGCCRLPRLIGFRPSLDLILSGRSVTAQQALKLGIVDHLMDTTETTARDDGHGHRSYDYKWFSNILACIEGGKLGKETFDVCERDGVSAVDACLNAEELNSISEDVLMEALVTDWEACERKAARKYPRQAGGRWSIARGYLMNVFLYLVALYQLWRRVGLTMPAPYTALHTTLRCLYAGSWLEAMQLNALGFVSVATTAEAKSLSSLFLLTRKLKGYSLTYGLDTSKKTQATQETLDREGSIIVVALSKEGMDFSSAFTQGLLYAGLEVQAICSGEAAIMDTFRRKVHKHFDYSLKRGHLKEVDIRSKMDRLHLFSRSSELAEELEQLKGKECCIVVHTSFSGEKEPLIASLGLTYPKVVHLELCPSSQPSADEHVVLVNVGDPVRKNTLCVEVSPSSAKVSPEDVRIAAALVSTLGKVPVVTPPSALRSASHYLAVHQWSLAVCLMAKSGLSPAWIDANLTRAGFSKGPFAVMKQLDRAYVLQMVELGSHSGIDCWTLKSYLTGKLSVRTRRVKAPPRAEVVDLFLAGAVHSALLFKKLNPNVPEAAMDILSISGLAHFPPSEGGPLNYVTRIGTNKFEQRLEELAYVPAIGKEAETLLRSCKVLLETKNRLFHSEEGQEEKSDGSEASEFQGESPDFVVLTAKELETVGPTRGLTNQEVLLYPLPAVAGFTATLLVLLILVPVILCLLLGLIL